MPIVLVLEGLRRQETNHVEAGEWSSYVPGETVQSHLSAGHADAKKLQSLGDRISPTEILRIPGLRCQTISRMWSSRGPGGAGMRQQPSSLTPETQLREPCHEQKKTARIRATQSPGPRTIRNSDARAKLHRPIVGRDSFCTRPSILGSQVASASHPCVHIL